MDNPLTALATADSGSQDRGAAMAQVHADGEAPRPTATGPSLTALVVKGTAWVFAGKVLSRGMSVAQLFILARLLLPKDFGLFAIVMLALGTLDTFTQTGFDMALIQRRENTEDYLDTAWTVQVVRGFLLAGSLFAIAPLVGWFFDEPRVVPLLRLLCVMKVLEGFTNIGILYFRKEFQFHKQVVYDLMTSTVALAVGVVLAYRLRSVWALVWAAIAGAFTGAILSYLLHPYRPRPHYNAAQAKELFRFGRWMLGSNIVFFLSTRLDPALVGKLLGAGALGVYSMAYMISNRPANETVYLMNPVMMPAFAKLQEDRRRLGSAFLQMFELVMSLAIPFTAFIVLAAPQIVLGLLGPQWTAAVLPLRILAVAGFFLSVNATGRPLFVGSGHPHMDFRMNLIRAIVLAVTVYPLTHLFGVPGTSLAVVLSLASTLPVWATVRSIADISWAAILRATTEGFLLAGLVAIAVLAIRVVTPGMSPIVTLVLQSAATALICGAAVLLAGRLFNRGLSVHVRKAWTAMTKHAA